MMSELDLTRRVFLRLVAAVPVGLTIGCDTNEDALTLTARTEAEEGLRTILFAVGPWTTGERRDAESFFERFRNAVPVSDPYLGDREALLGLAGRFPAGTMRIAEIDVANLPRREKDLLLSLVEGLYDLLEIRNFLAGEPKVGVCQRDRSHYVVDPGGR